MRTKYLSWQLALLLTYCFPSIHGMEFTEHESFKSDQSADMLDRSAANQALLEALTNNDLDAAQRALVDGADIHERDADGTQIIHRAAEKNALSFVIWLVGQAADINSQTNNNNEPLHYALAGSNQTGDREPLIKWLVEHGANISAKNQAGWEPMLLAISAGQLRIVAYLIERGIDLHSQNSAGENFLHVCAQYGRVECAIWFFTNGVDINAQNNQQETPLDHAMIEHQIKMATWLFEHGAVTKKKEFIERVFTRILEITRNLIIEKQNEGQDITTSDVIEYLILLIDLGNTAELTSSLQACKALIDGSCFTRLLETVICVNNPSAFKIVNSLLELRFQEETLASQEYKFILEDALYWASRTHNLTATRAILMNSNSSALDFLRPLQAASASNNVDILNVMWRAVELRQERTRLSLNNGSMTHEEYSSWDNLDNHAKTAALELAIAFRHEKSLHVLLDFAHSNESLTAALRATALTNNKTLFEIFYKKALTRLREAQEQEAQQESALASTPISSNCDIFRKELIQALEESLYQAAIRGHEDVVNVMLAGAFAHNDAFDLPLARVGTRIAELILDQPHPSNTRSVFERIRQKLIRAAQIQEIMCITGRSVPIEETSERIYALLNNNGADNTIPRLPHEVLPPEIQSIIVGLILGV